MDEHEGVEQMFCLPTDSAVELLKGGVPMDKVVSQLGKSAWQKVPLSQLGELNAGDLGKITHLSHNFSAAVQNYLIGLEQAHAAAGNGM